MAHVALRLLLDTRLPHMSRPSRSKSKKRLGTTTDSDDDLPPVPAPLNVRLAQLRGTSASHQSSAIIHLRDFSWKRSSVAEECEISPRREFEECATSIIWKRYSVAKKCATSPRRKFEDCSTSDLSTEPSSKGTC